VGVDEGEGEKGGGGRGGVREGEGRRRAACGVKEWGDWMGEGGGWVERRRKGV